MFIEVYRIPISNWNQPLVSSKNDDNKRLISINCIRDIGPSFKCEGRAEITMKDGGKITVVGSYREIIERVSLAVTTNTIQTIN